MSTAPHILCLLPWLTLGGADKLHLDLLTELHRRGWRISVITTLPSSNPWLPLFEPLCEEIIVLGTQALEEQPTQLIQHVKRLQPGWVLISNCSQGYYLLPALRQVAPATTFVDYSHAIDPDDPRGGYPALSLDQAALLDLQITVSATLREWMIAHGGEPERIHICHAGIDTDRWDVTHFDRTAIRTHHNIPAQAFVGLFPARLERVKQPYLALRLMAWLVRKIPDAHFLIAGDGSYAPFMRSYIRTQRLGKNIHMLGAVTAERMPDLYAISDVLLLPSQMEGLSVAIYEAMAMGLVPLSVAAGGQGELVTPETGFLITHSRNEEAAYRAALYQLATDSSRLHAMGQAGSARIREHFRRDQYGERFELLLQQAYQLHKSKPRTPALPELIDPAIATAQQIAQRDAGWYKPHQPRNTLRSRVRQLYWWLIEVGAWWLVPFLDWVRQKD